MELCAYHRGYNFSDYASTTGPCDADPCCVPGTPSAPASDSGQEVRAARRSLALRHSTAFVSFISSLPSPHSQHSWTRSGISPPSKADYHRSMPAATGEGTGHSLGDRPAGGRRRFHRGCSFRHVRHYPSGEQLLTPKPDLRGAPLSRSRSFGLHCIRSCLNQNSVETATLTSVNPIRLAGSGRRLCHPEVRGSDRGGQDLRWQLPFSAAYEKTKTHTASLAYLTCAVRALPCPCVIRYCHPVHSRNVEWSSGVSLAGTQLQALKGKDNTSVERTH